MNVNINRVERFNEIIKKTEEKYYKRSDKYFKYTSWFLFSETIMKYGDIKNEIGIFLIGLI
ncbi:hypothetical protein, partial [Gluconacetobacter entanii]